MHDIFKKTGPYLHSPDDLVHIQFQTGGTQRSFSVILAAAHEGWTIDRNKKGIAILDNDERQVVLDQHLSEDHAAAARFLTGIHEMSWVDFSSFCRDHQRYRGKSPDINDALPVPLPGSRRNQEAMGIDRGVIREPGSEDIRSDLMIMASRDSDCPYVFPRTSREEAIRELSEARMRLSDHGTLRFSWDIGIGRDGDLSGQGDLPIERSRDISWIDRLHEHPEIIEESCMHMVSPYLSGNCTTWGCADQGRYVFEVEGESGGNLTLTHLDGSALEFASRGDVARKLEAMSDTEIRDIWKIKRTLDEDLSPQALSHQFKSILNRIRHEIESVPASEMDGLVFS